MNFLQKLLGVAALQKHPQLQARSSQQPIKRYEDGSSGNIAQGHLNRLLQAHLGLGTADGGNPQNAAPPQLQGMGRQYQLPQIQGSFNPGQIPLQQSNIRYRQGPQPTQPWYDF